MERVEAFKDNSGRLHATKRAAAEADFAGEIVAVWGMLSPPITSGPEFARSLLAAPGARQCLIDACEQYQMDIS